MQVIKTDGASSVTGALEAYEQAIKEACHYIYIENQYLFNPRLGEYLSDALYENEKLQVIIILPFKTEEGAAVDPTWLATQPEYSWEAGVWDESLLLQRMYLHGYHLQYEIVKSLREVPNSKDRVGIYALGTCSSGTQQQICPHSKIMIVDDLWAIIGSANTNGRGIEIGKRDDLIRGSFKRDAKVWKGVKRLKPDGGIDRGYEKILGDGDFIDSVLKSYEEELDHKEELKQKGWDLERLVDEICSRL